MEKRLFLMGLFVSMFCSLNAVIIDPELDDNKNGQSGGRPRTIQPIVALTSQDNLLVFNLSNYVGIVNVDIFTANLSVNGYISGNGTFVVDASGVGLGQHEFTVTLSNGMSYHGSFIMR